MELSGTFATVVGLICNFVNERRNGDQLEYQEFMEWLSSKRHNELRELINENNLLSLGIKKLINERADNIVDLINSLDKNIAQYFSQSESLGQIAEAVYPHSKLSEQAIEILEQIEKAQASKVVILKLNGNSFNVALLDATNRNQFTISEPRFFLDDLNSLANLGFLNLEPSKQGQFKYSYTRRAHDFLCISGRL